MKRYIAFSLGVESTTMCVLYGKGATAIFTDTGSEHKELYARLELVEAALKDLHGGDFTLQVIKPSRTANGIVCRSLQEEIEAKKFMPSGRARFCTVNWKIEPMDAFLKSQGECELLIGLNADEEPGADRTGNLMRCENVRYQYPLYENGYTRADCKAILRQHSLEPNYPVYMARGGVYGARLSPSANIRPCTFSTGKPSSGAGQWRNGFKTGGLNSSLSAVPGAPSNPLPTNAKAACSMPPK